jgi:hypothetical protein
LPASSSSERSRAASSRGSSSVATRDNDAAPDGPLVCAAFSLAANAARDAPIRKASVKTGSANRSSQRRCRIERRI